MISDSGKDESESNDSVEKNICSRTEVAEPGVAGANPSNFWEAIEE